MFFSPCFRGLCLYHAMPLSGDDSANVFGTRITFDAITRMRDTYRD
jgi:hypothetical protein